MKSLITHTHFVTSCPSNKANKRGGKARKRAMERGRLLVQITPSKAFRGQLKLTAVFTGKLHSWAHPPATTF